MKIIFISDLHLSLDTFSNNQLFYALLEKWQNEVDALYILGDFFDYWLGDDDNNSFIAETKAAFKKFTEHKPIYFIAGNHDFALGKAFARESGITIIKDLSVITFANLRILLSHGDAFCTLDINYQRMKKILQNKLLMALLLRTPLAWRYKIKEKLEHKSKNSFNSKPQNTYHVVNSSIRAIANKIAANIVIHGHTHKPDRYLIDNGQNPPIVRYELPDWLDHKPGGYLLLNDSEITLHIPS